jgi:hypothetical protein
MTTASPAEANPIRRTRPIATPHAHTRAEADTLLARTPGHAGEPTR